MAEETCIVCLGDLCTESTNTTNLTDHDDGQTALRRLRSNRSTTSTNDEDERIAQLLPCKHYLHNSCVQRWVERANSCPICRANFNQIELSDFVNGPVVSSYSVQDKEQQADVDPTLVIDDTLFEEDDPCLICGTTNNAYESMFCDGCDRMVHVFCAGSQEAPDVWYCHDCMSTLEANGDLPTAALASAPPRARSSRTSREPRTTSGRRTRRGRNGRPSSDWARVWQSVWTNLNLDLDFPFDDEPVEARRTFAQRRDFDAWQRRLRVANHQGAANRFRQTAPALLDAAPPEPESQDEIRAWNAFEKAREVRQEGDGSRRKRQASTASPASPHDVESAEPERRLKRPRTRRNQPTLLAAPQAESSHQARSRAEGPSFLTSLLHEVDQQIPPSDHTSPISVAADESTPLPLSSPDGSPPTSNHGTPRAVSLTPPPLTLPRPSYTPLTSIVRPMTSPVMSAYSPFSPIYKDSSDEEPSEQRGRVLRSKNSARREASLQSPSRSLSFSTKSEIQRMVKNSLGPRYRNGEITKDQYTDINRDVSRMLYEIIEDANDLADTVSRTRLQNMASSEVEKAVEALKA